jgi:predicted DCC family thiol-disulfide oxidoreductase YuxK
MLGSSYHKPEVNVVTVYYDGECHVCSREISVYQKADRGQLKLIDISHPDFKASDHGLDPREVQKYFHVRTEDGRVRKGVDAFVEIWKVLPNYRFLVSIAHFPPVNFLMRLGYEAFAAVRPLLPKRVCRYESKIKPK